MQNKHLLKQGKQKSAKTSNNITNRRRNYKKQTSADMTIENKQ